MIPIRNKIYLHSSVCNWLTLDSETIGSVLPLQVCPSPVNPGLHLQRYDPLVLLHIASALQLDVPSAHSFTSVSKTSCPSFKFTMFIKYITFKNTKLSAALLDDTNKATYIYIYQYLVNHHWLLQFSWPCKSNIIPSGYGLLSKTSCPSFKFTMFIKYITFKNTKLSAALLDDTNKKQNIFTFLSM